MSNVYGKVPISSGQSQILQVGGSGLSGVLIANESGLTCQVSMQGANVTRSLYAGTVDFFPIQKGVNWTGNLIVSPSADLNNISFWPSSFLQIDTFGLGESPSGTYPINLNRTGNIGNNVSLNVGNSTSVSNDNNASGTEFIEATVLGSPSSNEAHFNDGSGWIGRWVNPTFTKVFQWFSAGSTALQLGAVALLTEILGNLKVDGDETVTGTGSWNAGGATIDGSSAFNGSAINVTTANVGTVNASTINDTTINTTTLHATSTITSANNQAHRFEDSGGTPRKVLNTDGSNKVTLSGITGTDLIQFLDSSGTVESKIDLINGIVGITGSIQSVAGDTSGTMAIQEILSGPVKLVVLTQSGFRQAGGKKMISLKNAFTNFAWVFNGGPGGIRLDSAGVAVTVNQTTWGTGTSAGTTAGTSFCQRSAAGFCTGFDAVGANGGDGGSNTGLCIFIGQ